MKTALIVIAILFAGCAGWREQMVEEDPLVEEEVLPEEYDHELEALKARERIDAVISRLPAEIRDYDPKEARNYDKEKFVVDQEIRKIELEKCLQKYGVPLEYVGNPDYVLDMRILGEEPVLIAQYCLKRAIQNALVPRPKSEQE